MKTATLLIEIGCEDACDLNNDGALDLSDAIYGLAHQFQNGAPPAAPYGTCGADDDDDTLGCYYFDACP